MSYKKAADFIMHKIDRQPEIGVVLGSGLAGMAEKDGGTVVEYGDIPDFPTVVAPGHKGRFVFSTLAGWPVVYMQGRFHGYDGYTPEQTVLPIRVMRELGVKTLIVTNAAGGINLKFKVGDIMLIEDHISYGGKNPLIGKNDYELGPRFPDMSEAYDAELRSLCRRCAKDLGLELKSGVYIQTSGPSYETPAEIRFFRAIGADAVGMSTVPEVIAARHMNVRVLGLSLISNMAAGVLGEKLTHKEVMDAGDAAAGRFSALIEAVAAGM